MAALLAASVFARMPIGINALATVLFLRERAGSFAIAGAAAGGMALGTALGAPVGARFVDRFGPRALVVLALVHSGGLVALIVLGSAGVFGAAIVAAAIVVGAALPPTSSVMRSLYGHMLGGEPALVRSAFALDSILTEVIFLVGPLLTAVFVAAVAPVAPLVFSAAATTAGTVAFAAVVPRAGEAETGHQAVGRLGALRAPGIQTLVLSMVPVGFAFGAVEVAIPAFARANGDPELAGVLVSIWSLGSILGGLVYGARSHAVPLARAHVTVTVLMPVGFFALLLSGPTWSMALLVIPAGVLIAPLIASRNELAGVVALPGSRTEAYTWPLTALVGGIAAGAAAAGALVQASGWRAAVAAAALAAVLGACISVARRATLRPAPSRA
jgi:MFS family permease